MKYLRNITDAGAPGGSGWSIDVGALGRLGDSYAAAGSMKTPVGR